MGRDSHLRSIVTWRIAVLVAAAACGCREPIAEKATRPVLVERSHSHYHVHAPDVVHGHDHADFPSGGHTHDHDGH